MEEPTPPETPPQSQEKKSGVKKGCVIGAIVLGCGVLLIIIIGIVAKVVFSGASKALQRAEAARAENTAYNLKTAISTYFTEYRKHPVPNGTPDGKDFLSDHEIMDVLLASASEAERGRLNPRKIVFFNDRYAKPMANGKYRSGVKMDPAGGGELWDPWGNYYHIRLDLNYDNTVKKPLWDKSPGPAVLPESILIWSAGKDGIEGTKDGIEGTKDDIKTW